MRSLTVVIAVAEGRSALTDALAVLAPQLDKGLRLLVVGAGDPPITLEGSDAEWIECGEDDLVPRRWALGMARAESEWIALTTSHFVPASDWLDTLQTIELPTEVAALGGAFDPPKGHTPAAWATYFLRYGVYLNFQKRQPVEDLAADNAAYRRADLERHRTHWEDGFWEPEIHRHLLADGRLLIFEPSLRVKQHGAFDVSSFCRQRRSHGRRYGADRLTGRGTAEKLARLATSPLLPAVLLAKVARRILPHRPYRTAFLTALPALALFVGAWALGEAEGYWSAR